MTTNRLYRHTINISSDQLQTSELATRFDIWMKKYNGHDGTQNEELVDWLYCDSGAQFIKDYAHFCELASLLQQRDYKEMRRPTLAEYQEGVKKYSKKHPLQIHTPFLHYERKDEEEFYEEPEDKSKIDVSRYTRLPSQTKEITSFWYRIGGDFYENIFIPTVDKLTRFRNPAAAPLIKAIGIYRHHNKNKTVIFILEAPIPAKLKELESACKKHFSAKEYKIHGNKIELPFNTITSFNKVMAVFDDINTQCRSESRPLELASEILIEITQISDTLHHSHQLHKHIIPVRELMDYGHTSPLRETSLELVNYLNTARNPGFDEKIIERHVKKLLAFGENPNQRTATGWSPLYNAVASYGDDIIKSLVRYRANPFLRDDGIWFETPIELAFNRNKKSVLNIFAETFIRPQKALSSLRVNNVSVSEQKGVMTTRFEFPDFNCVTQLKAIELMTPDEKAQVHDLFLKLFEISKDDSTKIETMFSQDFAPNAKSHGKFVELIYAEDAKIGKSKLIGFNLFSLQLGLPGKTTRHALVCEYSGMDENYRQLGLGMILAFRPAFGLQPLLDDPLIVHFFAITYLSYRLIEDLLHSPMYQPESNYRNQLLKELIARTYHEEFIYHQNTAMAFAFDLLRTKGSTKKSLLSEFFEKEILGFAEVPRKPGEINRGGLILVDVADEFLKKMMRIADGLGFNFITHMYEISALLPNVIPALRNKKTNMWKLIKNYPRTSASFWQAAKVAETIDLRKSLEKPVSKI